MVARKSCDPHMAKDTGKDSHDDAGKLELLNPVGAFVGVLAATWLVGRSVGVWALVDDGEADDDSGVTGLLTEEDDDGARVGGLGLTVAAIGAGVLVDWRVNKNRCPYSGAFTPTRM